MRGPSSVVYGSQNMGGVINIIIKTGRTAPGTFIEAGGGSWGLLEGKAQNGGTYKSLDWYVGTGGGGRKNYHRGGSGDQQNTAWTRDGGTGALGYQIDDDQRIDLTVRSDGVYDAGFVGSARISLRSTPDTTARSILPTMPRRPTDAETSSFRPITFRTWTI